MKLSSIFGAGARAVTLAVAMAVTGLSAEAQDMSVADLIATEKARIDEAAAAGRVEQAEEFHLNLRRALYGRLDDAAREGRGAEVREILQSGLFPQIDDLKTRVLGIAAENGREDVVEDLLAQGAKPESYMFSRAADIGNRRIINLLLDHGVSVNAYDGQAAQLVAHGGHMDIVEDILDPARGADLRTKCEMLIGAALGGHIDIVDRLLDEGAHINVFSGRPLAMAVRTQNEAMFDHLMARGADVNGVYYGEADEMGAPLSAAVDVQSVYFARKLIDAGAIASQSGPYILSDAVNNNDQAMVELLLAEGVDVNARDGAALGNAIHNGNEAIMLMLLDAGANPWLDSVVEAAARVLPDEYSSRYQSPEDLAHAEMIQRMGEEIVRRMQRQAPQP